VFPEIAEGHRVQVKGVLRVPESTVPLGSQSPPEESWFTVSPGTPGSRSHQEDSAFTESPGRLWVQEVTRTTGNYAGRKNVKFG